MKNKKEQAINWIFKDKYNEKWNPKILEDIRRYQAGEPIDYIIGWKPFLNCKIDLSLKPLIPRPETEYWTERFLYQLSTKNLELRTIKVLDIFAEIDPRLIKQIKINLKLNRIRLTRAKIIRSDVFSALKSNPRQWRGKYDFILANPPYIRTKKSVQRNVLKYEPKKALFGGKNGMFYIKKFLAEAKRYLNPNGEIWMEFLPEQKSTLTKIIKKYDYQNWQFYKDQYERWRCIVVTKIELALKINSMKEKIIVA